MIVHSAEEPECDGLRGAHPQSRALAFTVTLNPTEK